MLWRRRGSLLYRQSMFRMSPSFKKAVNCTQCQPQVLLSTYRLCRCIPQGLTRTRTMWSDGRLELFDNSAPAVRTGDMPGVWTSSVTHFSVC